MLKLCYLIAFFLLFNSCADKPLTEEMYISDTDSGTFMEIQLKMSMTDSIITTTVKKIDSLILVEGDIIIGNLNKMKIGPQGAYIGNGKKWPNNTIPYVIEANHPGRGNILNAINTITNSTNLNLVPKNSSHRNWVVFLNRGGCASYVGNQGIGGQPIFSQCHTIVGKIIHEILHASGIYHEHTRRDRDSFVKINLMNVKPEAVSNFTQYLYSDPAGRDCGNYDYGSIMHYGEYFFSINRSTLKTIEIKIPPGTNSTRIGQRNGLSTNDINCVNMLYPSTSL